MSKFYHQTNSRYFLFIIISLVSYILFANPQKTQAIVEPKEPVEVTIDGSDLATEQTTATPNPDSINQAINERINKKLTEEQRKKVNDTLESLSQLRRVVFGTVEKITSDAINIRTSSGLTLIPLNDQLLIKNKDEKISTTDIEVDNQIIALGALQSANSGDEDALAQLEPHLLVVFTSDPQPKKPIAIKGNIVTLSNNKLVMTSRSNNESVDIVITKNTQFEDANGKVAKINDFTSDVAILVAGFSKDDKITASTIRSLVSLEEIKGIDD